MMRTAIVICVLALFLHCVLSDFNVAQDKCRKKLDYKGEAVDIKLEGASKEDKCFLRCVMENKGALRKDGSYDVEVSKASIAETKGMPDAMKEKLSKVVEECAKEVKPEGHDQCELAYKYFQCKKGKMLKKD